MNRTSLSSAEQAQFSFAISVSFALALSATAPPARAHGDFTEGDRSVRQVFCDMSAISGQLTSQESRYAGSGSCVRLESPQKPDDKRTKTSEFPRLNESREIFRADWTSQGSYNPVTKETWEKVTMPAPATDQTVAAGRPYGNYETRMICATDPWLTGIGVNCTGKTVNATGNLGDAEAMLRLFNRPVTTPNKPAQLQALVASHDRDAKLQTRVSKVETNDNKAAAVAIAPRPNIVEPREGATYPPQTPLRVRIVPAKDAKDTAYRIEIQAKVNFAWVDVITVATAASIAQSPQGYRGWGGIQPPGTRGEMTATVGDYRLRARGTAPQPGQPGDWVEFRIDGKPGPQIDAMNPAKPAPQDAAGGAAKSLASRTGGQQGISNAFTNAPASAVQNKATAVTLNPQPLPPKTAPAALTATPLASARNKAASVLPNPQPLPPGGVQLTPGSLQQAPGGLPQVPSSMH